MMVTDVGEACLMSHGLRVCPKHCVSSSREGRYRHLTCGNACGDRQQHAEVLMSYVSFLERVYERATSMPRKILVYSLWT